MRNKFSFTSKGSTFMTEENDNKVEITPEIQAMINAARSEGFTNGKNIGFSTGYARGHADGKAEGLQEGTAKGELSATDEAISLLKGQRDGTLRIVTLMEARHGHDAPTATPSPAPPVRANLLPTSLPANHADYRMEDLYRLGFLEERVARLLDANGVTNVRTLMGTSDPVLLEIDGIIPEDIPTINAALTRLDKAFVRTTSGLYDDSPVATLTPYGLTSELATALAAAEITTIGSLRVATSRKLFTAPGVGAASISPIDTALAAAGLPRKVA
jgi:hypothetical protein